MPLHRINLFLAWSLICRNENVLGNTATAFVQGLYPPSLFATSSILTNGSDQANPLNGYQYVLVNGMPSTAPDTIWIKGDKFCPTMTNASELYYQSDEFLSRQTQLQSFYDKFTPLLAGIFPQSEIGFQSAYGIFDYLNVGYIHNDTIFSRLSADDLFQLRTLADSQELALVYDTSSPNVSIGGKTLAASILSQLNKTVAGTDKNLKLTYFAASYSVFQAFFGISGLLQTSVNFYGLPAYASTMSFELRRPTNDTTMNKAFVRFNFRNGSDPSTEMQTFPLFGRRNIEADMPWSQFVAGMSQYGISTQEDWCNLCYSNLTFCAAYPQNVGRIQGTDQVPSGSNMTNRLITAGAIGAGVAIAVIFFLESLVAAWWVKKFRPDLLRSTKDSEKLNDTTSETNLVY